MYATLAVYRKKSEITVNCPTGLFESPTLHRRVPVSYVKSTSFYWWLIRTYKMDKDDCELTGWKA